MFKDYRILFFCVFVFSSLFYGQARACSHDQAHVIQKVHASHSSHAAQAHAQIKHQPEKSELPVDCDCGSCQTHCCANVAVISKTSVFTVVSVASPLTSVRIERPVAAPFLDGPFQPPRA